MKQTITTLLFIFCANVLLAQSLRYSPTALYRHRSFISNLLLQNQHNTASKTTSVKERVIAQSTRGKSEYFIPIDSLTDSVLVKYSGSRNSTYDYNMMLYAYNYPYSNSPLFNYQGIFTRPQVLYDTVWHWTLAPNLTTHLLTYGFYEKSYCTYNVANNLLNFYDLYADSANIHNMSYINTFNIAGNIVNGYWFNLVLGSPDSAYKQLFSYNGSKLMQDSIYIKRSGSWSMVAKTYYTYDVTGNLTQVDCYSDSVGPLREKLKYENTYDGSNRLHTVNTSEFDGTNLVAYGKDTFDYTGSLSYHSSWKEHLWDGINHYWAPISYMSKHLNVSLLPDTVYYQVFDSLADKWVPSSKDMVSYDTLHNPITINSFSFIGSAYTVAPVSITRYYYEQYIGAGVPTIVPGNDNVLIYPNPATDKIFISQLSIPAGAAIVISVVNTNGQLVRQLGTAWQGKNIEIPIKNLLPGMYSIIVSNTSGELLRTGKVIKQ